MSALRPHFEGLDRLLRRQQGGQSLAIVAVAMTCMIGIAAFVVDVGSWYQVSRQAQAAADAGATAAAEDLPSNPTKAATDAQAYVNKNISGATTTVVTPYGGSSSQVKVTVSTTASTFFAKIFGISSVSVTESAAAKSTVGSNNKYAIFAGSTVCTKNNVQIPGSSMTITGTIRSNGDLKVSGSNDSFGATTYGGPNGCGWQQSGSSDTWASGPSVDSSNTAWPEPWDYTTIPCNFNYSGNVSLNPQSGSTYTSGVYCDIGGTIQISKSNVSGTMTIIASRVQISGTNVVITPYYQDLLIDSYGTSDFQWSGGSAGTTGTIYVPQANCNVSGSNGATMNLFLECYTVQISGSGWNMVGNGPPSSGINSSQLIE